MIILSSAQLADLWVKRIGGIWFQEIFPEFNIAA